MFVVHLLLTLYFWVLVARLVMEYVMAFSRSYRPSGAVALLFEAVYSVTDPPLKLLRRYIPPLRVGNFSLDLSFLLLIITVQILNARLPH